MDRNSLINGTPSWTGARTCFDGLDEHALQGLESPWCPMCLVRAQPHL